MPVEDWTPGTQEQLRVRRRHTGVCRVEDSDLSLLRAGLLSAAEWVMWHL